THGAYKPAHELREALGPPSLAAPVGGGPDREHRAARRHEPGGDPLVLRQGPKTRRRRRIEIEHAAELAHARLVRSALAALAALSSEQEVRQRGAAEVDNKV